MSDSNKSYRIRANVQNEDYVDLNLNLVQDIDTFEILSLNVSQDGLYKLHTSNYGCLVGRVLANNSVGVPNVNLSIFIEADSGTTEDEVLSYLYPYRTINSKNDKGIRYNLLTEEKVSACHQNVGTFPVKRLVLDDHNVFEVYDKYYKFTTTTNKSGDYMMFGIPVGNQYLHMDLDISDIGDLLSQRPRDMIYKGYSSNLFDSASMFKKDTNLDTLTQIFTQDTTVYIHPFWGEPDEMGEADSEGVRITRRDINLNYKFEPTCVFMGSLVTDEKSNGFTKKCVPTERMGKMDRLTTGEGTIEMIRKTPDGSVEQFNILGNQLIDGNGTWCYQIPMNLDYVRSDEYGNIVPTDNPNIGIPTRARVRFRISLNDFESDYQNNHLTKILVPNNPKTREDASDCYAFGSLTPDDEEGTKGFRDLFWNNVYTVKSYIPRLQNHQFLSRDRRFSGVKAVNVNVGNNPIPYNNMRIDITFLFVLQCSILHMLIWVASAVNKLMSVFAGLSCQDDEDRQSLRCVTVGNGACPDMEDWYFAPNCPTNVKGTNVLKQTLVAIEIKEGSDDVKSVDYENGEVTPACITSKMDYFVQCIEIALAQEYEVIQFDFYNDWINGLVYIPRWFANIRKKRSYLFGLIRRKQKLYACMEGVYEGRRKYVQQCALTYEKPTGSERYTKVVTEIGCNSNSKLRCHKRGGRKYTVVNGGYVHEESTLSGLNAYYFKPCDWDASGKRVNYFATDIVLLGSMSQTNMDGIPQTFRQLTSSSYQMPTNLAATNMASMTYMYGTSDGSVCSSTANAGNTVDPQVLQDIYWSAKSEGLLDCLPEGFTGMSLTVMQVVDILLPCIRGVVESWGVYGDLADEYVDEIFDKIRFKAMMESTTNGKIANPIIYENTAEGYKRWSYATNNEDYDASIPSEVAVTEASGIDWGYTGPGQDTNTPNSMYKPGGHFLGISCYNSESSIKSCVNLSRVCELGSMLSQMHYIPKEGNNDLDYSSYTVPTGLISGDELEDGTFRNEFATLNHNGLKTRFDYATGRRVYDIYPMLPVNYDGGLGEIVSRVSAYNNLTGTKSGQYTFYKRTIEDTSGDYYDFRLGLHEGENPRERYLYDSYGSQVSMPMYENSFYFYFGLHDGSTALDRFFKEFYADCPVEDDDRFYITVEPTNINACSGGKGSVSVSLLSVPLPVDYKVVDSKDTVKASGTVTDDREPFVVGNLDEGNYRLILNGDGVSNVTKSFKIQTVYPSDVNDVKISVTNFTEAIYYTESEIMSGACINNDGGYVVIDVPEGGNVVGISLQDTHYYSVYSGTCNVQDREEIPSASLMDGDKMYLWQGNGLYLIRVWYQCSGGSVIELPSRAFTVKMPLKVDLSIGGSENVTYRKVLMREFNPVNSQNWWKDCLNSPELSDDEKWYVERAVTYRGSLGSTATIDVVPKHGTTPYNYEMTGNPESVNDGTVEVLPFDSELDPNNYKSFVVPTKNLPTDANYGISIVGNTKKDYGIRVTDADGDSVPENDGVKLSLPSVYKPFFFRSILYRNMTGSVEIDKFAMIAVNGCLYQNKFEYLDFNSVLHVGDVVSGNVAWWDLTGGKLTDFSSAVMSGTGRGYVRTGGLYTVSAKENAPADASSTPLTYTDTVRFPGDQGTVTSNVRYFKLYRSLLSGGRAPANVYGYGGVFSELTFLPWKDGHIVEDGKQIGYYSDGNTVYWNGSVTNAFAISTGDGAYFIFNPANELDRYKILAGDTGEITESGNDCYIIAVYDPWTRLSDDQFKSAQKGSTNNGYGMSFKYENVSPDANMLTVIAVYTANGFKNIVNGGSVYTYEETKIVLPAREKDIEIEPNQSYEHFATLEYESDQFALNADDVLYIPQMKFTVNSDVQAYYNFRVYVKKTDDPNGRSVDVFNRSDTAENRHLYVSDAWEKSGAQMYGAGFYKIYVSINFGTNVSVGPTFVGSIWVSVDKIEAEVRTGNVTG